MRRGHPRVCGREWPHSCAHSGPTLTCALCLRMGGVAQCLLSLDFPEATPVIGGRNLPWDRFVGIVKGLRMGQSLCGPAELRMVQGATRATP
eukprot:1440488-Prorocentrum_lima.AAC.1